MRVFLRTSSEFVMGISTSGRVTTVSFPFSSVCTAYGSISVYTSVLSPSWVISVRFLPYSMTTPVFRPRLDRCHTSQLSHSYSPPHRSRNDPATPPRQARTLCGFVMENAFASE